MLQGFWLRRKLLFHLRNPKDVEEGEHGIAEA